MMPPMVISGISLGFPRLFRCEGQIAHVLLTRSPLVYSRRSLTARLACVKHAASVRPEPGSNSPLNSVDDTRGRRRIIGVSQQERLLTRRRETTVLLKEPSDTSWQAEAHFRGVDGALINSSSTFGTLLSSQGSGAHRRRASRPALGRLDLTYRLSQGQSTSSRRPGRSFYPRSGARPRAGSQPVRDGSTQAAHQTEVRRHDCP
jgi:hypothetical protein